MWVNYYMFNFISRACRPARKGKAIKVAIIGGSNSVIKTGYTAGLQSALSRAGFIAEIDNMAIGANTSIRGLMDAVNLQSIYDVYVIEYFVNDYSFFARYGAEMWQSAFEALLRICRSKSPHAVISLPLIGRRDQRFWQTQEKIRSRIMHLAELYGAVVTDIDSLLRGFGGENLGEFYLDGSHLRGGIISSYCSNLVAIDIAGSLNCKALPRSMPKKTLSEYDLSKARVFEFSDRIRNYKTIEFSNSKYHINALVLREGETMILPAKGATIGLAYVSARNSCDLLIDRADGARQRIHTLHNAVRSRKFSFLLRSFNLMDAGCFGFDAKGEITLRAARSDPSVPICKEYNMVANLADGHQSVYLLMWMEV